MTDHTRMSDSAYQAEIAELKEKARFWRHMHPQLVDELEAAKASIATITANRDSWANFADAWMKRYESSQDALEAVTAERDRLSVDGYEAVLRHAIAEANLGKVEAERDEALKEHTDMMWQRRRAEEALQSERSRAWLAGRKAGADCAREWAVFGVASDIDALQPPAEFAAPSEAMTRAEAIDYAKACGYTDEEAEKAAPSEAAPVVSKGGEDG